MNELEQKVSEIITLLRVAQEEAKEVEKKRLAAIARDEALSRREQTINNLSITVTQREREIESQLAYIKKKNEELAGKEVLLQAKERENLAIKAEKEQLLRMRDELQKKQDQIDQDKEIARKRTEILDLKEQKINEKQAALQRYLTTDL